MRVLSIGPPLYGLLYPLLSLAQAFRLAGHDVVVASAGRFTGKVAEAGLVGFDAAPGLDSEAEYRRHEKQREHLDTGAMGRFTFFSEEMADRLVEWTDAWRPDLIVYPPLGVVGPLLGAKFGIPVVMHAIGFAHTSWHIQGVTRSLSAVYERHAVAAPAPDLAWIDVTPPSMSLMDHDKCPVLRMRYVPYNGGAVWQDWWPTTPRPQRPRIVVSLGTLKPMVDGLSLIDWVMDSADQVDADFVLALGHNARAGLRTLPDNVRLVDWIPMGPVLATASGFIHHGGAGNTLTALSAGVPQIAFGEGADRPVNAKAVADRGCGLVPSGPLDADLVRRLIDDAALRAAATEVSREMAAQHSPGVVVDQLLDLVAAGTA